MKVRNSPSELGAKAGEQLARLYDNSVASIRALGVEVGDPCTSCAFRLGTYPNQCTATVADAIKCIMEKDQFMCHALFEPDGSRSICKGYQAAALALIDAPALQMPYDFSHVDD